MIVPAGTGTWTKRLEITKGITLQGQTTIGGSAQSPVITDKTIILDDTPRAHQMMLVSVTHTKNVRITGITFKHGTTVTGAGSAGIQFNNTDAKNGPNKTIRVDHCHFDHLGQAAGTIHFGHKYGWFEGVIDHCAFYEDKGYAVVFSADGYWPASLPIGNVHGTRRLSRRAHSTHNKTRFSQYQDYWGNGSWADYAYFGSDKFMFLEDCHIERTSTAITPISATDTTGGARRVIRYNYIKNYVLGDHGTEGGSRDHRCDEVYGNTFEWTYAWGGTGYRGGNAIWHDNTFLGKAANSNKLFVPQSYRAISAAYIQSFGNQVARVCGIRTTPKATTLSLKAIRPNFTAAP